MSETMLPEIEESGHKWKRSIFLYFDVGASESKTFVPAQEVRKYEELQSLYLK